MTADKDRYIIAAVVKAGAVLKAVANGRDPMLVSEIEQEVDPTLGMDTNSVFRQCVTLEYLGFLAQVGDRYELGMGLGLFWAKKKAILEAQRTRIDGDITLLGD